VTIDGPSVGVADVAPLKPVKKRPSESEENFTAKAAEKRETARVGWAPFYAQGRPQHRGSRGGSGGAGSASIKTKKGPRTWEDDLERGAETGEKPQVLYPRHLSQNMSKDSQ